MSASLLAIPRINYLGDRHVEIERLYTTSGIQVSDVTHQPLGAVHPHPFGRELRAVLVEDLGVEDETLVVDTERTVRELFFWGKEVIPGSVDRASDGGVVDLISPPEVDIFLSDGNVDEHRLISLRSFLGNSTVNTNRA